ncbi:hypothetical protein AVEN_165281-1 [Araneus ventricosus]|uniref:Tc1-like transposase DDE domain-containing protein n=1 Tax=Araneus ventricosus TaxID=182803 RepID=A0A4Y2ATJ3_ARAVE|nr:hypothetical protein AVEN_165281-1 [Araneus ventricosus]
MASSGVGNPDLRDGAMNRYVYLAILKRNLKQSAINFEISRHFKLQQDNDPKHTADIYKLCKYLCNTSNMYLYHCPGVIKTPVQCAGLNPIEHVWDYLQQKINEHNISNKQGVKKTSDRRVGQNQRIILYKIDQIHVKSTERGHKVQGWPNKILTIKFIFFS